MLNPPRWFVGCYQRLRRHVIRRLAGGEYSPVKRRVLCLRRIVGVETARLRSKDLYHVFYFSFLWKFKDTLHVYKWTGKNDYVALCEPDYLSFGGGQVTQVFINVKISHSYITLATESMGCIWTTHSLTVLPPGVPLLRTSHCARI